MCYYTYLVQHTTHYFHLIQHYTFNYLVSVDKGKASKYNLTCHRQGIALFEHQKQWVQTICWQSGSALKLRNVITTRFGPNSKELGQKLHCTLHKLVLEWTSQVTYLQWNLSTKETLSNISFLRTPVYCLNHAEMCVYISTLDLWTPFYTGQ